MPNRLIKSRRGAQAEPSQSAQFYRQLAETIPQMAWSVRNGNGGWGLPMMRERAEAVGGRLSIEHVDPGTRIVVEVPLGHGDQRHPG